MKPRTVVISLGSALVLGQSLAQAERKPEVDPVVKSIREVEENSKQMSAAIDQLQQLLASLPKSEPPPPVAVPANPPPARTPLRRPSKPTRITP